MTGLSEVLALIDVERLDTDIFRGFQPEARPPRVFGGQVLAQGLSAGGRSVPDGRLPHSLHAYFIRPGHSRTPIIYEVARLRDGGSLSVRRISAIQDGEVLCEMTASFAGVGGDHRVVRPAPEAPAPEDLPTVQERLAPYAGELDGWWVRERPFQMRPVGPTPREAIEDPLDSDEPDPVGQLWIRADGTVPDDPLMHIGLLAYASDMTLLEPVLLARRLTTLGPGSVASLDHAMWFHQVPDVSDWLLYDTRVLGHAERRGLAGGQLWTRAGELVGTVNQEGYLSPHVPRHWNGPRLDDSVVSSTLADR